MTASRNGRLRRSELVEIAPGILVSKVTARRVRRLMIRAKKAGKRVDVVRPAGGYRSVGTQDAMQKASVGKSIAAKRRWNLSTTSTVRLAKPYRSGGVLVGTSSHGFGTRVDLLIDGSSRPTRWLISNAAACGLVLEFPGRDPNHFVGRGKKGTTPLTRAQCVKYGLHVGPKPKPKPKAKPKPKPKAKPKKK